MASREPPDEAKIRAAYERILGQAREYSARTGLPLRVGKAAARDLFERYGLATAADPSVLGLPMVAVFNGFPTVFGGAVVWAADPDEEIAQVRQDAADAKSARAQLSEAEYQTYEYLRRCRAPRGGELRFWPHADALAIVLAERGAAGNPGRRFKGRPHANTADRESFIAVRFGDLAVGDALGIGGSDSTVEVTKIGTKGGKVVVTVQGGRKFAHDPDAQVLMRQVAHPHRVAYLDMARRRYLHREFSLPQAEAAMRTLKRRGLTTWVETADGTFVPVKGATRPPSFLPDDNPAARGARLSEAELDILDTLVAVLEEDIDGTRTFYVLDDDGRYAAALDLQKKGVARIVDAGGKGKKAWREVEVTDQGIRALKRAVRANPRPRFAEWIYPDSRSPKTTVGHIDQVTRGTDEDAWIWLAVEMDTGAHDPLSRHEQEDAAAALEALAAQHGVPMPIMFSVFLTHLKSRRPLSHPWKIDTFRAEPGLRFRTPAFIRDKHPEVGPVLTVEYWHVDDGESLVVDEHGNQYDYNIGDYPKILMVVGDGVDAVDTSAELALINRQRRSIGQRPLDPVAAGWTDDDVRLEADALRARGYNPRTSLLAWS